MVRVGGGWDTLEHYLIKHDPNHYIPKITAKEICDTVSHDIAAGKKQSIRTRTPVKILTSQASSDLIKYNKGYFSRPATAFN